MKLDTQYLLSTTAGVAVRWRAPRSGPVRINCLSRVTWPASLVLDVKVSVAGTGPQYPKGFTTLQFTANGISDTFIVNEGMEILVIVNTLSGTSTEIELTPSME